MGVKNGTHSHEKASYRPTPKVGRRRGCSGNPAGSPAAHAAAAAAVEVAEVEVEVVGPRALAVEVVAWVVGPRARAEPIGRTEPRAARRLGQTQTDDEEMGKRKYGRNGVEDGEGGEGEEEEEEEGQTGEE